MGRYNPPDPWLWWKQGAFQTEREARRAERDDHRRDCITDGSYDHYDTQPEWYRRGREALLGETDG